MKKEHDTSSFLLWFLRSLVFWKKHAGCNDGVIDRRKEPPERNMRVLDL